MRGIPLAVAGLTLSTFGWALIWLFPFAFICRVLGAAFFYAGERGVMGRGLPHLWIVRAGSAISILPVVIFTGILLHTHLT